MSSALEATTAGLVVLYRCRTCRGTGKITSGVVARYKPGTLRAEKVVRLHEAACPWCPGNGWKLPGVWREDYLLEERELRILPADHPDVVAAIQHAEERHSTTQLQLLEKGHVVIPNPPEES